MKALVGAVIVVAVLWLAILVFLAAARPRGFDLAAAKRFVPDIVRLFRDLARDEALPRGVRVRLVALGVYLAMPIDLVPDFVPVLGYADDVIVVALVLRSVVRAAGPDAVRRHWHGTPEGLALVERIAGITPPKEA